MTRFFAQLTLIFLFALQSAAQAIDNTASFRAIDSRKYIRLHYENDYFTATDEYYTQGINLEFVSPSFRKFLLAKLLLVRNVAYSNFGIAVEHNGYTPTSIESNDILYGDRPFAATLMLKTFSFGIDTVCRYRITSSLSLGVIGSAAKGYEMQREIHRWINDQEPMGWQHQIQNDAIINYEFGIEKNLLSSGNIFIANVFGDVRIGTLSSKASLGSVIMIGRLNDAITSAFSKQKSKSHRKMHFHVYAQPMINLVGYDATLQGGMFNNNSPYTIASGDIMRGVLQINYGGILTIGDVQFDYFKTAITREFETGASHRWGGIRIGYKF